MNPHLASVKLAVDSINNAAVDSFVGSLNGLAAQYARDYCHSKTDGGAAPDITKYKLTDTQAQAIRDTIDARLKDGGKAVDATPMSLCMNPKLQAIRLALDSDPLSSAMPGQMAAAQERAMHPHVGLLGRLGDAIKHGAHAVAHGISERHAAYARGVQAAHSDHNNGVKQHWTKDEDPTRIIKVPKGEAHPNWYKHGYHGHMLHMEDND